MTVDVSSASRASLYRPRGLLLQWHITERCNLRCAHCYQAAYRGSELELEQLLDVLGQFTATLAQLGEPDGSPLPGHVTVTGGEPFARADLLFGLLEAIAELPQLSFAILSNGTMIDAQATRRLRRLRPLFVQISIDGTHETHDAIRGRGSYQRAVDALRRLRRAGLRTMISFTAHRANYRELSDVVRLAERVRAWRVWTDRLIPAGSGADCAQLTPAQTRAFCELLAGQQRRVARRLLRRTEVKAHRALQFLAAGGEPYHCSAGDTLLTLQPNGDVYPCRRMPIVVGNVLERPLAEIYQHSPLLRVLRDRERKSRGCEACEHAARCRGGLRCLAHAVRGDPLTADPGCWLADAAATPD